jgi:hypothetical protein
VAGAEVSFQDRRTQRKEKRRVERGLIFQRSVGAAAASRPSRVTRRAGAASASSRPGPRSSGEGADEVTVTTSDLIRLGYSAHGHGLWLRPNLLEIGPPSTRFAKSPKN